jgi:hypothetical protein
VERGWPAGKNRQSFSLTFVLFRSRDRGGRNPSTSLPVQGEEAKALAAARQRRGHHERRNGEEEAMAYHRAGGEEAHWI